MNPNLVNGIASSLADVARLPEWMQAPALGRSLTPVAAIAAKAAIAFVAALPPDYTAADVYAAMTTDGAEAGGAAAEDGPEEPFCGNKKCPCAHNDATPCDEWKGTGFGRARHRCAECGHPQTAHGGAS